MIFKDHGLIAADNSISSLAVLNRCNVSLCIRFSLLYIVFCTYRQIFNRDALSMTKGDLRLAIFDGAGYGTCIIILPGQ